MKLVDILARELKDWPDQYYQIFQDSGGNLHGSLSDGDLEDSDQEDLPGNSVSIAWDGIYAVIDRAEWQAAVDALNAPKVVEWDGAGLPPIGSVVDTDHRNKEIRVKILAYGAHHGGASCVLAADMSHGREGKMFGWMSDQCSFRAVRTAEQVAAEERKAEILEMIDTFGTDTAIWGRDAVMEICGHLWESGYRKQVEK